MTVTVMEIGVSLRTTLKMKVRIEFRVADETLKMLIFLLYFIIVFKIQCNLFWMVGFLAICRFHCLIVEKKTLK